VTLSLHIHVILPFSGHYVLYMRENAEINDMHSI